MSRSFKKTIAWGSSTKGGNNRSKGVDYDHKHIKRDREVGIPIIKSHHRDELQTVEDYIIWIKEDIINRKKFHLSFRSSKAAKKFNNFLNGREVSEDLIKEFATICWKKNRSR